MPIRIIRDDITKVQCDAIVNAANKTLLGGGGVDGAIHKAAGIGLFFDCLKLRGCKVGEAKITPAHKLPCKYVIHTVGPKWKDGNHNEEEQLASCYTNSLLLAKENNCESVAFPLISTGVYKFPKEQALLIAIKTIKAFLVDNDMDVIVVVYKKANVDKKLFSKIRCEENYHPSKTTALAFAVALELNLEDTKKFIATAGYTLTHSSKLDLIVEYYIIREQYDVDVINMTLFKYDQKLLGY